MTECAIRLSIPVDDFACLEAVSKSPLERNPCVGRSVQIIEILEYSSGLNLAPTLILSPIEGFETASGAMHSWKAGLYLFGSGRNGHKSTHDEIVKSQIFTLKGIKKMKR